MSPGRSDVPALLFGLVPNHTKDTWGTSGVTMVLEHSSSSLMVSVNRFVEFVLCLYLGFFALCLIGRLSK